MCLLLCNYATIIFKFFASWKKNTSFFEIFQYFIVLAIWQSTVVLSTYFHHIMHSSEICQSVHVFFQCHGRQLVSSTLMLVPAILHRQTVFLLSWDAMFVCLALTTEMTIDQWQMDGLMNDNWYKTQLFCETWYMIKIFISVCFYMLQSQ